MHAVRKLLIFCPASVGGIADYANQQAKALAKLDVQVTMLCPVDYPHPAVGYDQKRALPPGIRKTKNRLKSRLFLAQRILMSTRSLAREIRNHEHKYVLFANFSEYLAPLWAGPFQKLRSQGIRFAVIVHDPVRDYRVGPEQWHRRSIAAAYAIFDCAFVHSEVEIETFGADAPTVCVIPHGPYLLPEPSISKERWRSERRIPVDAKVFLVYGHLRDGKNVDLILHALVSIKDAWLLVAGSEAPPGQKKSTEYKKVADQLGVGNRCVWITRYLTETESANIYNASDIVLILYSDEFRSASGALNSVAQFSKPVVASSGIGPVKSNIESFNLGKWTTTKELDGVVLAMRDVTPAPNIHRGWENYSVANSWEKNASIVIKELFP